MTDHSPTTGPQRHTIEVCPPHDVRTVARYSAAALLLADSTATGGIAVASEHEVHHMVSLLTALTQPDTATIRNAEAQLKPALKQGARMVLWAVIAATVPNDDGATRPQFDTAVRHVACIVLRKRFPAHYTASAAAATTADNNTAETAEALLMLR